MGGIINKRTKLHNTDTLFFFNSTFGLDFPTRDLSSVCITNYLAPQPVLCGDDLIDLLHREALGLRDAEGDEDGHENDKASEEDEHSPGHGAQHGQEGLADEEGEDCYYMKLVKVKMPMPAARVSIAWISEGTSQARGPQDQEKPAT